MINKLVLTIVINHYLGGISGRAESDKGIQFSCTSLSTGSTRFQVLANGLGLGQII